METPEGFGCVEPGLYRAASLTSSSLPFLASLRLRAILTLTPGAPSPSVVTFASSSGVDLVHLGLQPWRALSDYKVFTSELFSQAVRYVLDRRHYPLLVVDTNIFVGMLRKVQDWAFSGILAEYVAFTGVRAHYITEVYLEMLQVRLIPDDADPNVEPQDCKDNPQLVVHLPPPALFPEWFRVYYSLRDT